MFAASRVRTSTLLGFRSFSANRQNMGKRDLNPWRAVTRKKAKKWRKKFAPFLLPVILTEDVPKLGVRGELAQVKRGHARLNLFPKKQAVYCSPANLEAWGLTHAQVRALQNPDNVVLEDVIDVKDPAVVLAEEAAESLDHVKLVINIPGHPDDSHKIHRSVTLDEVYRLYKKKAQMPFLFQEMFTFSGDFASVSTFGEHELTVDLRAGPFPIAPATVPVDVAKTTVTITINRRLTPTEEASSANNLSDVELLEEDPERYWAEFEAKKVAAVDAAAADSAASRAAENAANRAAGSSELHELEALFDGVEGEDDFSAAAKSAQSDLDELFNSNDTFAVADAAADAAVADLEKGSSTATAEMTTSAIAENTEQLRLSPFVWGKKRGKGEGTYERKLRKEQQQLAVQQANQAD